MVQADFMEMGRNIEAREKANRRDEASRSSRRWWLIGIGSAVAVVGAALIGGRMLVANSK